MIDLDIEIFASAGLVYKAVRIDEDNIIREITLSQSNMILVLLKVAIIKSGILCLDIVISFIQLYSV